jgi:hypothetical protein
MIAHHDQSQQCSALVPDTTRFLLPVEHPGISNSQGTSVQGLNSVRLRYSAGGQLSDPAKRPRTGAGTPPSRSPPVISCLWRGSQAHLSYLPYLGFHQPHQPWGDCHQSRPSPCPSKYHQSPGCDAAGSRLRCPRHPCADFAKLSITCRHPQPSRLSSYLYRHILTTFLLLLRTSSTPNPSHG